MASKILSTIALIAFLSACSSKETIVEPTPEVEMIFGTEINNGSMVYFQPFLSQDSLEFGQIINISKLRMSIYEKNIKNLNGFNSETAQFSFDIKSNHDTEHFLAGDNCEWRGAGSGKTGELYSLMGEFVIPLKYTNDIIKNNDTLEIASASDKIIISYKSQYTGLSGSDSLTITKY